MRRLGLSLAVIALVSASTVAFAQGFKRISEILTGYEETPSAVSTTGNGTFTARISNDETQIQWELSYSDLEGAVQQSHIHFGQKSVTGPISVFLCTNLGNGPAGTQPCPAPPATISGTIVAADVTNLANERGISAGEFDELLEGDSCRSYLRQRSQHEMARWRNPQPDRRQQRSRPLNPLRRHAPAFEYVLAPSARGLLHLAQTSCYCFPCLSSDPRYL